jgi:hypothetical protein
VPDYIDNPVFTVFSTVGTAHIANYMGRITSIRIITPGLRFYVYAGIHAQPGIKAHHIGIGNKIDHFYKTVVVWGTVPDIDFAHYGSIDIWEIGTQHPYHSVQFSIFPAEVGSERKRKTDFIDRQIPAPCIGDFPADRFEIVFALYILLGQFFVIEIGFYTDMIETHYQYAPDCGKYKQQDPYSHNSTAAMISMTRE